MNRTRQEAVAFLPSFYRVFTEFQHTPPHPQPDPFNELSIVPATSFAIAAVTVSFLLFLFGFPFIHFFFSVPFRSTKPVISDRLTSPVLFQNVPKCQVELPKGFACCRPGPPPPLNQQIKNPFRPQIEFGFSWNFYSIDFGSWIFTELLVLSR